MESSYANVFMPCMGCHRPLIEPCVCPKCIRCGRRDFLDPDPAGYYQDAYSENGAPLLCKNCVQKSEKGVK